MDNRTALDKLHSENERARQADLSTGRAVGGTGIDLEEAEFIPISVNEIGLLQKQSETEPGQPRHDDPVAHGMAAWARPLGRLKYYIGKFRMDAMRWKDGHRHFTSVGFIKRAVDELFDGDGKPVPMWAIYLTENDEVSSDAAEQPVAIFTRKGIRFLVPILEGGGTGGGSQPSRVTRFYTDNGKFLINWQDDQGTVRAVIYRVFYKQDGTEDYIEFVGERQFWP